MALREKLRERIASMLDPGEHVQQVFLAQRPSPLMAALTYLTYLWTKMWIVAVTDRRIALIRSSVWLPAKPKGEGIEVSVPRSTRFGPPTGLWAKIEMNGERYYVHKRFHKDLVAADAEAGAKP